MQNNHNFLFNYKVAPIFLIHNSTLVNDHNTFLSGGSSWEKSSSPNMSTLTESLIRSPPGAGLVVSLASDLSSPLHSKRSRLPVLSVLFDCFFDFSSANTSERRFLFLSAVGPPDWLCDRPITGEVLHNHETETISKENQSGFKGIL